MYLETIDEKAFRSFLSNPAISVLDGNVLDKHYSSNFYRFVRVPLSDGEHSVEALFGQMCSNYPTSMLDSMGFDAVTGYFDPKEDERSGEVDSLTGYYYVDI